MKKTFKNLFELYVARPLSCIEFSRPVWLFLNRKPRALLAQNPPALNPLQEKIVGELKRDGISTVHIDDLFADDKSIYQSMQSVLPGLLANAKQDPKKLHFKALWDTRSFLLDQKSPFARFALSSRVVDIANAYFGMWTRLLLGNGYLAEVTPKSEWKVQTQNWHRDFHDIQLLSVFIYLTDVNSEEDGAFWFIKGSHPFGRLKSFFKQRNTHSTKKLIFPSDEAVDAKTTKEERIICLGKKGTVIFSDATGIHRGGHCTANPRVMVLTAYASDHRFSETLRISYPDDVKGLRDSLSPQSKYAAHL